MVVYMTTIYALFDIENPGRFRYVGQSRSFRARLSQHRHPEQHPNSRGPAKRWALEIGGERIRGIALEEVEPQYADDRERYWVERLRAEGHDLLNMLDGGRAGWHGNEAYSQALKGRANRTIGERHGGHRLTEQEVGEIRTLLLDKDLRIIDIAARYSVARQTINAIRDGRSWKHREDATVAAEGGRRYRRRQTPDGS